MARSRARRLVFVGVAALAAPVALACNQLTGLSDYGTGPCNGGGNACVDSGDAGGGEGGTEGGRGAQPVSWATWSMPDYPDAGGDAQPLTFDVNDDNTVTDAITSLVWERAPDNHILTYADATNACATLKLAGANWRLPKRIELITLLDYSQSSTLIDPRFTNVSGIAAWTSSEWRTVDDSNVKTIQNENWIVDFGDGSVKHIPIVNQSGFAFCVKAQ